MKTSNIMNAIANIIKLPKCANIIKLPKWFTALLIIATIIGVAAIVQLFVKGHIITNATQHVPWGLWVATYIYFIGISAGAFLLSSLIYVFKMKQFEAAGRIALVQAFLSMLAAGFFIIIDLGHPLKVYYIITSMNTSSVMAWVGIFFCAYVTIIALEMYYSMRGDYLKLNTGNTLSAETLDKYKRYLFILGLIGIPIALGDYGGVGSIFAVAKARPNWFGGLFPIVFIISALASGGGLLTFLVWKFSKVAQEAKTTLMRNILYISLGFLAFSFLLLMLEVFTISYGGIPHETSAWHTVFFGPFWYVFWILQLGIGLLFPLFVVLSEKRRNSIQWLGSAGLAIAMGIFGERLNTVIPAQLQETMEGMSEAYHHFRFELGYFPSANELLVFVGGIAIFVWIFLWAIKYLPVNSTESEGK